MSATTGIRTWKRLSQDTRLPLDERVLETTRLHDHLETALREADFITIPRAVTTPSGERLQQGYDEAYAARLAAVLAERYGFSGEVRTSTSGRSHVFERHAASRGATFDFGLRLTTAPLPINGASYAFS